MRDINRCECRGRLGRDAEVIGTEGHPGVKLLVLTNRSFDRQGEEEREVTAWTSIIWGEAALRFADLAKGQAVHMVGRFHLHQWEDQTGARREQPQFIVLDLEVLGPQPRQQLGDSYQEEPPQDPPK